MPRFPSLWLWPALAAACLSAVSAEEAVPALDAERVAAVSAVMEGLAATLGVDSGATGFYLAPLGNAGAPLAAREAGRSLIPASTIKTITTGAALELLGPEFRFVTELRYAPETGDLIIRGAGDPSLGRPSWEPLFENWENALRLTGHREIRGRVIADEGAWEPDELADGWTWLDIGNYYAPVLTPLCFHDNAFRMYFRFGGKPGTPLEFIDADPWPVGLTVKNRVLAGKPGSGDNAYVFQAPGTGKLTLRGTFAADAGRDFLRAALPDPALFCAQQFTAWLNGREIPVHGEPATTRREGDTARGKSSRLLASWRSAPLSELLPPINHRSLNLDCECLLRTIGKGSAGEGLRLIRRHLAGKGLPLAGYSQEDGSGLSRTNMITPRVLAMANAAFLTGPKGPVFRASLPEVGGGGGTLEGFPAAAGGVEIRAKSGTVERVKAYTGVVRSASGAEYIFAVMVNNYDGSYQRLVGPRMEELFEALAGL